MFAAIVVNEDLIDLGLTGKQLERSNANEEGDGRVGEMATEWTNHRCRENSIANEAKTEDENFSNRGHLDVRDCGQRDLRILGIQDSAGRRFIDLVGVTSRRVKATLSILYRKLYVKAKQILVNWFAAFLPTDTLWVGGKTSRKSGDSCGGLFERMPAMNIVFIIIDTLRRARLGCYEISDDLGRDGN